MEKLGEFEKSGRAKKEHEEFGKARRESLELACRGRRGNKKKWREQSRVQRARIVMYKQS